MIRDATFSPCGTWRYTLKRRWDDGEGILNVVGLNPSTADAEHDDPTVRRCIDFGRRWGFGAVVVTNVFAYRATNPRELRRVMDPIGPNNDAVLLAEAARAHTVLVAWGVHGDMDNRADAVLRALAGKGLMCLGTTQGAAPRHPLYVRRETLPVSYPGSLARSSTGA